MEQYPHIKFRRHWSLTPDVYYQLGQCEAIIEAICDMPIRPEHHGELLRVSLQKGAQATTAIEGNTLTDEEVEKVAAGESLPPSREYQEIEVRNVIEAMNAILKDVAVGGRSPMISADLIKNFHKAIGKDLGEHFNAVPGRFREDSRVVGTYRCPQHEDVPQLVDSLCEWLTGEFEFTSGQQSFSDAVVQAIVTHVYIEWIHPFGDGNGRIGRLLEFYILLRAGNPDIASHILSNFYNQTRPEYYRQLDHANKAGDLSEFIAYTVQGFRDGLIETLHKIQESQFQTAWRSFVYDRFAQRKLRNRAVSRRQRDLVLSMPLRKELSSDDLLILTPEIARAYASSSERMLARDLKAVEEMDLVKKTGRDRYIANSDALKFQMARRLQR